MKSGITSKKSAIGNSPNRARPASANGRKHRGLQRSLSTDGVTIDWEHVEKLGEQARQAAIRLGVPPPEPWPEMTEEEWARAEESARLVRAIPRRKFKQTSEEMIREMRDAQVGIFPKGRNDSADR